MSQPNIPSSSTASPMKSNTTGAISSTPSCKAPTSSTIPSGGPLTTNFSTIPSPRNSASPFQKLCSSRKRAIPATSTSPPNPSTTSTIQWTGTASSITSAAPPSSNLSLAAGGSTSTRSTIKKTYSPPTTRLLPTA